MIVNVTPLPDGSITMDPTPCEVGKFCPPQGPDPDHCGTLRLEQDVEVKRTPGNVLIIFDQSGSMQEPWGTNGETKAQAAQKAVATAVTSLKDLLTVGAIFFPTTGCFNGPAGGFPIPGFPGFGGQAGSGGAMASVSAVEPIEGLGQIPFRPAPAFLSAWSEHWN